MKRGAGGSNNGSILAGAVFLRSRDQQGDGKSTCVIVNVKQNASQLVSYGFERRLDLVTSFRAVRTGWKRRIRQEFLYFETSFLQSVKFSC